MSKINEFKMKYDPITIETKKIFKLHNKSQFYNPEIKNHQGFLFQGSKNQLHRILTIIDRFVKKAKKKGYNFKFTDGKGLIIIQDINIELRFREKNKRVKYIRNNGWVDSKLEPTGILSLKVHHSLRTREWSGTMRTPLEDKVEYLLDKLEGFAQAEKEYQEYLEKTWADQAKREEEEQKIKDQRINELKMFKDLITRSERWNRTRRIQKYLEEMELNAIMKEKVNPELNDFLSWAVQKLDWYNPFIEREDKIFENVDRDTLEIKSRWR